MTALLLLRRFWPVAAVVVMALAIWGGVEWHRSQVTKAYNRGFVEGAAKQKAADKEAVAAAERAATDLQRALKATTAKNAAAISKGTDDALQGRYTVLARSYDDLRMQWAAHRAAEGGASTNGATGAPGPARVAADAYCAASGWVSLDVASAAAEAADTAIAKDDAWRGWYWAQEAAWPK